MMTFRRSSPRRRLALPADPSEDELARHWSLTPADLAEIGRCRGDDHRRRFALQLCMMRAHGRFLDDYRQAPLRIVNHLSRQLGLAPVLFLEQPGRGQTEREQALRIRRYLGLESFDSEAEADLREWLRQGALEGRGTAELLVRAEDGCGAGGSCCRRRAPSSGSCTPKSARATAEAVREGRGSVARRAARRPSICCWKCRRAMPAPACSGSRTIRERATAAAIKGDIARLRLIDELLGDGAASKGSIPRSSASSANSAAAMTPATCGALPSPNASARRLLS